jgi:hypothetical protein
MSGDGDVYFTWTSQSQDGSQGGVFARLFTPTGGDFIDSTSGRALGEFRVNATTDGNQFGSVVAADADGDLVVAWVGPDFSPISPLVAFTDIYARLMGVNEPADSTVGIPRPGGGGGGGGTQNTWRNPAEPLDVNADGDITAIDVLLVVNRLNTTGPGALGAAPSPSTPGFVYLDVNGDNFVSALDALQIINHLNDLSQAQQAAQVARSLAVEEMAGVDPRLSAVGFAAATAPAEEPPADEPADPLEGLVSAVAQVRAAAALPVVEDHQDATGGAGTFSDAVWSALGMLEEDEEESWALTG